MKKEDAIRYLQQLYPNGGHCWLDEQRIEAINMAVKSLQKETVSEELSTYINELSKQFPEVSFAKLSRIAVRVAKWQKEQLLKLSDGNDLSEPVSEDLEEAAKDFSNNLDNIYGSIGEQTRNAFKAGAKWWRENNK